MPRHVNSAADEEGDTLALEQSALAVGIGGADSRAQRATPLHDTLPGHPRAVRSPVHRPAHDPGRAGSTQHPGDLAVGRHLAPRHTPDQSVDAVEETNPGGPVR